MTFFALYMHARPIYHSSFILGFVSHKPKALVLNGGRHAEKLLVLSRRTIGNPGLKLNLRRI